MSLLNITSNLISQPETERDFIWKITATNTYEQVSDVSLDIGEEIYVPESEEKLPSFRKLLFPIKPATAANVIYSPKTDIAAAKKKKEATAHQKKQKPRIKAKYELFKEKKCMKNYKSSLADAMIGFGHEKSKGSIRFAIGESELESNMTISALNNDEFSLFEDIPASEDKSDDQRAKAEDFDLQTFLEGLKLPKATVRNLKSSRLDELRAKIEESGSVQEGLSKEECLYYIEAFNSIDSDQSGAITEVELFEAMDKLNMDCSMEKVRDMIKSVDTNGDGDVSVDEFLKLMAGLRSKIMFLQSNEQMEFAFSLIDRDQDNLIGLQDLVTLFEEIGDKEVDFNSCRKMLHSVLGVSYSNRKSEDPKINFAQFVNLVKTIGQ